MTTLQFLGATRQVTGSCYLLESGKSRILFDCGMFQGGAKAGQYNQQDFAFNPREIDAVVLSHAHIDHSGLLPKLVKQGFQGAIYLTPATHDLIDLMLKDSAKLGEKDIHWENKRRQRAGKDLIEPLYSLDDVKDTLALREAVPYGQTQQLTPDISVCFREAGHILGSAIVEINIHENATVKKLVFSGDLGNSYQALLRDPEAIEHADVLLLESTYGDRNHRSMEETLTEFEHTLEEAAQSGGNILIPAFSIGRTQELLFHLGKLYRANKLKQNHVFLDSPMAISASDIYHRHMHLFNDEDGALFSKALSKDWTEWLPILRCTRTTEESMEINRISGGAIIIAGNGMCTGGRIVHHLKNQLWRSKTHIIIVGFQAYGSTGRAIVDGAKTVNILGTEIAVKAQIHTLGGFSAHADQSQLLTWAKSFKQPRPELYLIHGELEKNLALQKRFHQDLNWYANIPSHGEKIVI